MGGEEEECCGKILKNILERDNNVRNISTKRKRENRVTKIFKNQKKLQDRI